MSGLTSDHARPAPDGTVTGRAEARRLEIRSAIASAAMGLVVERGLDDVTVDEIARAANVSRRTFFNYFPSKAAACIPETFPPDREAVELFLTDHSLPTMTAVGRLLWRQVAMAQQETPSFVRFHDMWRREQGVRAEIHAVLARTESELAALIAKREGTARGAVEPATVAAASIAIVRVAVEQWRTDESPEMLEHRIREAFEAVARSLARAPGEAPAADT